MGNSHHFVINWSGVVDALSGRRSTVECQNRYQTLRRNSAKLASEESGSAGGSVSTGSSPSKPMSKATATATANLLTTVSSAVKAAVAGALIKGKGRK